MSRPFADLVSMNRHVVAAFQERERRAWGVEVSMVELPKQVGDLARAIMSAERYYLEDRDQQPAYIPNRARIADEIADILYCILRIADHYGLESKALTSRREKRNGCRCSRTPLLLGRTSEHDRPGSLRALALGVRVSLRDWCQGNARRAQLPTQMMTLPSPRLLPGVLGRQRRVDRLRGRRLVRSPRSTGRGWSRVEPA
jgi:hypothetical protein